MVEAKHSSISDQSHPAWLEDLGEGPVRRWLTNRLGPLNRPIATDDEKDAASSAQDAKSSTGPEDDSGQVKPCSCQSAASAVSTNDSIDCYGVDESQSSADLAANLSWRLHGFLGKVEQRKKDFDQWFSDDKIAGSVFSELSRSLQKLSVICLRGDDDTRCKLANEMLKPEFALLKAPDYTIHFEHSNDSNDAVFLKRKFGGWCTEISRDTFEALAYSTKALEKKDYENVHTLCVRGNIFRFSLPVLSRVPLVIICDEGTNVEREQKSMQMSKDADDRARLCGFATTKAQSIWAVEIAAAQMGELHVMCNEGMCDIGTKSEATRDHVKCTCALEVCLQRVLHVASENLACFMEAFVSCLNKVAFADKVEYWKGLRSSDATSQKLLSNLFDACLKGNTCGGDVFEGAQMLCEQYVKDYPNLTKEDIAYKLVQWQASLNLSTGFVTGFGGFLTMPITIPTGLLATWLTSARLAFAVAHLHGHDIFHPRVTSAVLYCLTGSGSSDVEEEFSEDGLRTALLEGMKQRTVPDEIVVPLEKVQANDALMIADGGDTELQNREPTLYDLLGVSPNAMQQEIRIAYRKLALLYHPDKLPGSSSAEDIRQATENFQMLSAAYEELGDPVRRQAYDDKLARGDWSWAEFVWNRGLGKARSAFEVATQKLTEVLFADHHDLSGHMASRAATHIAVDLVEHSTVGAAVRAGSAAELRSSILAGEKLAANAASKGSSRLIPILGALISGAIDCATTASVGRCSIRVFKV